MKTFIAVVLTAGVAALAFSGCAGGKGQEARIGAIEQRLDAVDSDLADLKRSDAAQEDQLARLSENAKEALARSRENGELVKGHFLYELRFSDNNVKFAFDKKTLSDEAKTFLDLFASRLKDENRNVFIEIQGRTDNVGPEQYNLALGKWRADMVMRYLHETGGIPLNRMRAISFGEEKPIADNGTQEGRATNRTVVLMVME
jgi:outer membrane protein OmpA-like peptidoglycan-associated protein